MEVLFEHNIKPLKNLIWISSPIDVSCLSVVYWLAARRKEGSRKTCISVLKSNEILFVTMHAEHSVSTSNCRFCA